MKCNPWALAATAVGIWTSLSSGVSAQDDPWPERQKTRSRTSRTDTIGPQVPVVAWKALTNPTDTASGWGCSPVLDASGRLFVAQDSVVSCLSADTGELFWQVQFDPEKGIGNGLSLWNGHLLFGSVDDFFYCLNSASGETDWRAPAAPHPNKGQVVSPDGIVYYPSQQRKVYARRVTDGALIWEQNVQGSIYATPALSPTELLFFFGADWFWFGQRTSDGQNLWTTNVRREVMETSPVENGRVYVGSSDYYLYCLDEQTGTIIWRFWGEKINRSTLAIGHDGTIYHGSGDSSTNWLFAVNPDGTEKWRFSLAYEIVQPPTVAGDGTIYVATNDAVPRAGRLYAIRSTGTLLWSYDFPGSVEFPANLYVSPTLGPDGTLYVLSEDKYLYAFRDWQRATPQDLAVRYGSVASGSVADLAKADGSHLVLSSVSTGPTPFPFLIEATYGQKLLHKTIGRMDIKLKSRASMGGILQEIRLKRRGTSTYDLIDSRIISTSDMVAQITDIPNAQDYVRAQDGRVEAKVTYRPVVPLFLSSYTVRQDHLEAYVKFVQ
ncbi:MAG: PQQ-binding-like beta-propeller repeat protein [Fimbriimonadaceae bacterium]